MSLPSEPITRKEQYLAKAAGQAVEIPSEPITREEAYLDAIAKGSGGGGGTSNYNDLSNKPQIGGTTLTGNKSASDLGLVAAVEGKGLSTNDYTDADKAIVGGVTAALAGKQGALTAGKYIDIDANNEISVEREIPDEAFIYTIQQIGDGIVTITKTVNGAVVFEETYNGDVNVTLDALQYVYNSGVQSYTLLIASDTHEAGFKQVMSWWQRVTYTENFSTVDHSGEKLIIKSEMDTALAGKQNTLTFDDTPTDNSNNPVKSGGVYSALAGKQDTLTFDNAPTDGSNNPVKSDGIYDALAGKQDIFERISYADWQLLSPQQQAAKPYYIYDYPNSGTVQAANVAYSNTSSGLSATTAQGGIDELASEKQDKTDNNLTTTNKTIVGGINELKSGLTNVEGILSNIKIIKKQTTTSAENVVFNLSSRGAGLVLINQNGKDSTVGVITVSNTDTVHYSKLLGLDVTIDDTDYTAVSFAIANWSSVTILCNTQNWS